ncbi:MAG: helix-turn-helix transcriptional regulator [Clostridia bacterium]|nr:helix-turn-helix transcriptional regulator [Clostridia bacterium]
MALTPTDPSHCTVSSQGKELVSHGTALFPAGFYFDDLCRFPVPWHWHDELEVMIVHEGLSLVAAGSRKYTLHAGQGMFINAGVLHGARRADDTVCRFHSVVFSPRLIGGGIDSVYWQKYLKPLIQKGPKSVLLDGSHPWHQQALASIESAWQEGANAAPGYEFRVRASLSELIFSVFSQMGATRQQISEKAVRDGERIKLMLQFIHDHYAEQITLSDIAQSALISESECLRCFKSTIGHPPIQFLKQLRVRKAAELLVSSNLKINEISDRCGFQDSGYFTRAFRELKGMTPNQFRQSST